MLHDCNLKIYNALNIHSDFNIGILVMYIIEGKSIISIDGISKEYNVDELVLINDLEQFSVLSDKNTKIASLYITRVELERQYKFDKIYSINRNLIDYRLLKAKLINIISVYINDDSKRHEIFESISELVELLQTYKLNDEAYLMTKYNDTNKEILNAINYMYSNHKKKLLIAEVARNSVHSRRNFPNKVNELTGMRYLDVLKMIRLMYCTYDLIYTNKNLAQIAVENGHPNESAFIDCFRKRYKITPAKFRKQMSNDRYITFSDNEDNVVRDFSLIRNRINKLTKNVIEYLNIEIEVNEESVKWIKSPELYINVTHIDYLTNQFYQTKLLGLRREYGQYGLYFSHHLINELCNLGLEHNKQIDQMFAFSLEHQFDISFEIVRKTEVDDFFDEQFERLLAYLSDCTYFYGQRSFKFYVEAMPVQNNKIVQRIKTYFLDAEINYIMEAKNQYLLKNALDETACNDHIIYKVTHDVSRDTFIADLIDDKLNFSIFYHPKNKTTLDVLISTYKWSIQHYKAFKILLEDSWIDEMIPSQSSLLVIKEMKMNIEYQYQLYELILTLQRVRGEVIFFNRHILITKCYYAYQIVVFPYATISKYIHQKIRINHIDLEKYECRTNNILVNNENTLSDKLLNMQGEPDLKEILITQDINKLTLQFYTSPKLMKHIYIKKILN